MVLFTDTLLFSVTKKWPTHPHFSFTTSIVNKGTVEKLAWHKGSKGLFCFLWCCNSTHILYRFLSLFLSGVVPLFSNSPNLFSQWQHKKAVPLGSLSELLSSDALFPWPKTVIWLYCISHESTDIGTDILRSNQWCYEGLQCLGWWCRDIMQHHDIISGFSEMRRPQEMLLNLVPWPLETCWASKGAQQQRGTAAKSRSPHTEHKDWVLAQEAVGAHAHGTHAYSQWQFLDIAGITCATLTPG